MKICKYIVLAGFYFLVYGCVTQHRDEPENPEMIVVPPVIEEPKPKVDIKPKPVCTLKKGKIIRIKLRGYKDSQSLKFLRVKANSAIDIRLKPEQAMDFLRQSKQFLPPNSSPIMPFIFRAVSNQPIKKVVASFWIQEKTISSQLYKALISDKTASATRISHENAEKVIKKLNNLCKNKVKFNLPTEEQFVHLARKAYDPATDKKLKTCQALKVKTPYGVKQVFGHNWQLTSSYCRPLDPYNSDSTRACDSEQYYIKKGGSIDSIDATECLPEYRAESVPDLDEPNTTFRLVLTLLSN